MNQSIVSGSGLCLARNCTRAVSGGVSILVAVTLLSACGNNAEMHVDNGQVATRIPMPEQLQGVRALVSPELELRVDGASREVMQDADSDDWIAQFDVDVGIQHHVQLRWTDQGLELVRAEEWFSTPTTDPVSLEFNNAQFDSSSDQDGDGRSNLAELVADTDPTDPMSPPEPVNTVILNVELPKPAEIDQVPEINDDRLVVRATLNGEALRLDRREDLNWFGQDNVSANLPAFVTVEWCYTLDSGHRYRLLRFARSISVGNENRFLASNDVDYRSDYDRDANGVSNIKEIAGDTEPVSDNQSTACL